MIQFTGNTKIKSEPVRRSGKEGKTWAFGLICKSGIMLIMIFSACGLRVYFSDRTEELKRQSQRVQEEIRRTNLEIHNLIAHREGMYSHKYIQSKIAQYKLDLRPTSAAQVHYLKYYQISPDLHSQENREVADAGTRGRPDADMFRTANAR